MAEQNKEEELRQRQQLRRQRRIRNQMISYVVCIAVIAMIVVLALVGSKVLFGKSSDRNTIVDSVSESQSKIEDILASEEAITAPVETEPPVIELTAQQKLDEIILASIEVMPLEDKVAGLFIVTPEAITGVSKVTKAGDGTREALTKYAVGGIIYFNQNISTKEQFAEMVDNTKLYAKYPLFMAVDEEGGSVARISGNGLGTKVDDAATIGATGDLTTAFNAGKTLGNNLSSLGLNLNLAPVADLSVGESGYIGNRSFGNDANLVSGMATATMQGIHSEGVTACLKHFPGIGSVENDPHKSISSTDRTEEEFRAEEFSVFQTAIDEGARMVMIANISAPNLTNNNEPCVFSERLVTDILRGELGFEGVVISDAMNMAAISDYYSSGEAAIMALKAGCDMILMPENFTDAFEGIMEAVENGTISEERINDSLLRIYRIKYADKLEKQG